MYSVNTSQFLPICCIICGYSVTSHTHTSTIQREMQWACHEGKTLGGSKLRFLPKLTGVRPIINLRSRVMTINNEQLNSVNYQLNGTFHILNMEMVC